MGKTLTLQSFTQEVKLMIFFQWELLRNFGNVRHLDVFPNINMNIQFLLNKCKGHISILLYNKLNIFSPKSCDVPVNEK